MKKNKILIVLSSILIIYTILGFVVLPKLIKPQIENIINENLTQKATLEKVEFNPFLLKFSVLGLKIFNDKETTVSAKKLLIDFSLFKSIDEQHISFKDLNLEDIYVNVIEFEDGTLNLEKLVKEQKNEQESEKSEGKSDIKFQIYRTILKNAEIKFTKFIKDKDAFKLDITNLNYTFYDMGTFKNTLASHSFKALINTNTEITINGGMRLEPFEMNGIAELKNFKPTEFLAYKENLINFDLDDKMYLNFDLGYKINTKDGLKVELNNANLDIKNLDIKQNNNSIISLKHFALDDLNLNYPENILSINSLYFDTLNTKIINNKSNILNLANLIKDEKELSPVNDEQVVIQENVNQKNDTEKNSQKDLNKWKVSLKELNLKNSNVKYEDLSNSLSVDTKDININLDNFNLDGEDFIVENVEISKPDIIFKDNKNNLLVENKKINLSVSNLNSKDTLISVGKVILANNSLSLKDKNNSMNVLTKAIKIELNTLIKNNELIDIKSISLNSPNISFKDEKNKLAVLTKSLSFNTQDLNINNSDIKANKIKLQTPLLTFNDIKNKMDISTKNINIIATNSSFIEEKLKIAILSLTKPSVSLIDNKNNTTILADNISLKINDIYNHKDEITVSKINLNEPNLMFKDINNKTDVIAKNIYLNVQKISHKNNKLKIVSSTVNKPYISVTLGKQDKVEEEVKDTDKKETKTVKMTKKEISKKKKDNFAFDIGPVKIKNMKMTFEDKNLPIPFKTDITKLNGEFSRLNSSSSKPTKLSLEGVVDDYGYTKISGVVDINDIKILTDTNLLFKNIAIKNFTPYSGKFVGREIESGKLNLDLKYNIKKSDLKAENSVIISDIKFGKNVESPDAVNLPLELAIALLEDSDGVIDLNLPVTGNVDDPEFSIAPIVWKAFTNLIVKAISSPFTLLASVFGISADDIKSIEFEFGKSDILASEKEALDNIAKILEKKQKLAITITPTYDTIKDRIALQDIKFEQFLIKEMNKIPEGDEYKEALEELYEDIDGTKDLNDIEESFTKLNKEGKKEFDKKAYVEYLRKFLSSNQKVSEDELITLAKTRVSNISKYLLEVKKVPNDAVKIEDIKKQEDAKSKWAVFNLGVSTK